MAEPNKQQIGDGADSYGAAAQNAAIAAKQAANVGKEASKTAATTAAAKGAEATANAAAATVKAGVEGGKAVAEIAAGTASGGPWGAIIAAAWAMRHTLFKILVCICLCVVFLIVLIVELPGILINRALGLDGSQPTEQVTIVTVFETVTDVISNIIGLGYDSSMTQVETLIADGGYDYELSMNALVNHAQSSAGYDVAYIMSAYSTSVDQLSATQTDLEANLSPPFFAANIVSEANVLSCSLQSVNLIFKGLNIVHQIIKRWILSKHHFSHILIICTKAIKTKSRRNKLDCSGNCFFVFCPFARIELHFESYNFFEKFQIFKSYGFVFRMCYAV